jgi:UDP-N-acetylmuramoyl-L-alanyl-D-glutamate--2,6-diaminopimelate ligase
VSASLAEVAARLRRAELHGRDVEVVDATHDSRTVVPGALFCAIPGSRVDGHDLVGDAVAAGASAALVERWLDVDLPQVRVPSVRAATGPAAAVVHGDPSRELTVVGTTGTNGKTTVSYLLEGAFAAAGRGTGVIGTVETRIHGERVPGVRTTPEGTDLQRLLRTMYTRGVDAVAMEVSSHGLDLRRVDGTRFRVAIFTNLSQDHLDWHGSMEAYLAAKARLFQAELSDEAVVVLDGPWSDRLLAAVEVPVTTVGRGEDADVRLVDERTGVDGGSATLRLADRDLHLRTQLPGGFNLLNAAAAVVAAIRAGVDDDVAIAGVAACPGAPGRLERVDAGQAPTVLVDYAHTPDAVEQVLHTLRGLLPADGRLLVVLGCGGDRDREKRAPMGAATTLADVAVLTSDNPRTEDPHAILRAMEAGAREALAGGRAATLHVEADRREAIRLAVSLAGPQDVVLVAGKGHETSQEFADRTVPFDDRLVVREVVEAARTEAGADT